VHPNNAAARTMNNIDCFIFRKFFALSSILGKFTEKSQL